MENLKGKEKRAHQKMLHERFKVMKEKIEKGEPTTFAERNIYRIAEKRRVKK